MRKPAKSHILTLLALLLTLGVGVFLWMPGPLARWAGESLTHQLQGKLPVQVSVGSVRWHFFPLGVRLMGVQITSPGAEGLSGDFVAIRELVVFPDLQALRSQRLELRDVRISGLTLVADVGARLKVDPSQPTPPPEQREELAVRLARKLQARLNRLARWIPGKFSAEVSEGTIQLLGMEGSAVTYLLGGQVQLPEGAGGNLIQVEGWLGEVPILPSGAGDVPEGAGPRLEASVVVDLGAPSFTGRIRPTLFPLEPLLKLVASRVPERVSAHLPSWPRISGNFEVGADLEVFSWNGNLELVDVEVFDDALAPYPIGPLTLGFSGAATLARDTTRLTLENFKGTVGSLTYHLLGWIQRGEGRPQMDLTLQLQQVPYQHILTAAPPEDLPALQGVVLGGDLDFEFHASGDLDDPEAFLLDYTADWSRLTLAQSPFPRKVYPLAGFPYHPVDPSGKVHQYQLGRGEVGWVPLENVPAALLTSVLMSEDITFYQHRGFDEEGLRHAFTQNLKKGRAARGGSTITQQLAKNLFLTKEKTVVRKFQEAVLTYVLEQTLTKQQIMETYLNIIEWGPGIYGLGRASATLFGKPAAALTVKESAYLATIIPNPRRFYMYFRRGELTENWDRMVQNLLDRMVQVERITPEQYMEASQEILQFRNPTGEGGASYGEGEENWEE